MPSGPSSVSTPNPVDVCASEPIRTPGSIMPHGILLAAARSGPSAGWRLMRASANAGPVLSRAVAAAVGLPLQDVLAAELGGLVREIEALQGGVPTEFGRRSIGDARYAVLAHRSGSEIVVEFEQVPSDVPANGDALYGEVRGLAEAFQGLHDIDAMSLSAAQAVRRITGFDRVLVYRFEDNWDGVILAEDRNDVLPSYTGLRFPASDIPSQARELYKSNRLRQIPDATYEPVPILATPELDGQPLDLSFSALRSVSPVHLEYMRNMGTGASMSISIVINDRLWGLISCHNAEPRRAPPDVRSACDFVAQLLAMGLAGALIYSEAAERANRQQMQANLLAAMAASPRFINGLLLEGDDLLGLVHADGAAVFMDGSCVRIGATPEEPVMRRIVSWLSRRGEDAVFATDSLSSVQPDMAGVADIASGLMAISISQLHPSYVLWFRAEFVRTIAWAGEPQKLAVPGGPDGPTRLHPRTSFATWQETVRARSRPWTSADLDAAKGLRSAIINVVLRRAEQLADLSRELERSNKELEAFSYSISHDLRAPFRHIVGYAELLREREGGRLDEKSRYYLETIIDSAFSAGRLVDDLLRFSQMGRMTIQRIPVSTTKIVEEVMRSSKPDIGDRRIEWRIGELPPVMGDPNLLRQVFLNLVSNAIKYTRGRDPAVIEIGSERRGDDVVFTVKDNGVGFEMAYVGKLFGVFQRLHRVEEFEGTGIGLANVRRIVERHGGVVSAEGVIDEGATFTFTLPQTETVPA